MRPVPSGGPVPGLQAGPPGLPAGAPEKSRQAGGGADGFCPAQGWKNRPAPAGGPRAAGGTVGVSPCPRRFGRGRRRRGAGGLGAHAHGLEEKNCRQAPLHPRGVAYDRVPADGAGRGPRPHLGGPGGPGPPDSALGLREAFGGGAGGAGSAAPARHHRHHIGEKQSWHSFTSNTGLWAPARPPTPL